MKHKKLFAILTLVCFMLTLMPVAAFADSENVAEVNGTGYTTLQAAIEAAGNGDTVKLLANITAETTIQIKKGLTLELGNYTITSTANCAVYSNGGNLTINAGDNGSITTTGTVAVGQDNGVCTINGGMFAAYGETRETANGKPVKYRYTLDNSNTKEEGITGSFVIKGGSFYMFNPACMFINYGDAHDHDSIAEGKTAVLDANGWFTVTEGELMYTVECDCAAPAPSHEYCYASYEDAKAMVEKNDCPYDKIVALFAVAEVNGTHYHDLQEAINAANAGDTVKLLANITAEKTIQIKKDLTLELGNYTIASNVNVAVYSNGGNLIINAGNNGSITTIGTVAVGQDNGVCTINGGMFAAYGDTSDVANGKPVKYRYTLDNSNNPSGITGSFVINGGSFYGFNPACMFINYGDAHDHDSIAAGKTAVLDANGWFTVTEGELMYTVKCNCDAPAPSHEYCYASYEDAKAMVEKNGCQYDKIVALFAVAEVNGTQYATLQDAINAANNSDVIVIVSDISITAAEIEAAFAKNVSITKIDGITVNVPDGYEWNADGKLVKVTVVTPSTPSTSTSSGGGFSGSYNYPINVTVSGADVTLSDNYAVSGETVTITVTPDAGKQVDEVIVTDADGDVITVTKVGDNQYSFTMPAGKVNVAVTTKAISYDNKIVLQIGNKNVVVDGRTISNDVAPVIQGDRTLVPIRVIVEALGGEVDWDEATRTVTITIDGKVLTLVIDEMIPGFGQGATIMDSRTYVPIRYVAEYIGAHVDWIAETQQIVILK